MNRLWVIAGPNGAGKSSLTRRYISLLTRLHVINPDTIAANLAGSGRFTADQAARAGRVALKEQRLYLAERRSFAVETTLTGQAPLRLLTTARDVGYKTSLVYVGLDDVGLSLARVAARVSAGGHDIPPADILRRFDRSMANLHRALPLVDRLWLFDNSRDRWRLILRTEGRHLRFASPDLPRWAADIVTGYRR
ncbi:AAA family ATPase [Tistrella mobilis]|uniref:AAA family ATPase n=1 Tax=Tistrella mobilis TaxID=171437 RepID=UPI0035574D67